MDRSNSGIYKKKTEETVRLFIGSIPKHITKKQLLAAVNKATGNRTLSNFHIKRKPGHNKSFAFFETKSVNLAIGLTSKPIMLKKQELYCQLSHKSLIDLESRLSMRGFIKDLPKDVPDRLIYQRINDYAPITSFYAIKDHNLKSKGYGFVDFEEPKDLDRISRMGGIDIFGVKVKVQKYTVKEIGDANEKNQKNKNWKDEQIYYEKNQKKSKNFEKKKNKKNDTGKHPGYKDENRIEINDGKVRSKTSKDQKRNEHCIPLIPEGKQKPVKVKPKKAIDIPINDNPCPLYQIQKSRVRVWGKKTKKDLIVLSSNLLDCCGENYRFNKSKLKRNNARVTKRICEKYQKKKDKDTKPETNHTSSTKKVDASLAADF